MKIIKIDKKVLLANNIEVKYSIEKKGQCIPTRSDRVIVSVTLYLPVSKENYKVVDENIQFTLEIFNKLLFDDDCIDDPWGEFLYGNKDFCYRRVYFEVETYLEGFKEAEKYVLKELEKIHKKLLNRALKYENAENSLTITV